MFITLHWLPLDAHIRFKALTLIYRVVNLTAPFYLRTLNPVYSPSQPLHSAIEQ